MKISLNDIQTIIDQEIAKVISEAEEDPTKITTGTTSAAAQKQADLDRLGVSSEEFTGLERTFVNQIEQFLTDLASTAGVDLPRYKGQLETTLRKLQQITKADAARAQAKGTDQ